MAAFSVSHYLCTTHSNNPHQYSYTVLPLRHKEPFLHFRRRPYFSAVLVTQEEEKEKISKKEKMIKNTWSAGGVILIVSMAEKLGRRLKDTLSPKQKGDWKDLLLMSLSFAVYVYISQKIVCAYCAWISMTNHSYIN